MDRLRNTGHWEAFSKLLGQEVQVAVLASPPKWSFKLLCSFTTHHPIYLGSWPQQFVDVLMLRWPFLIPQLQFRGGIFQNHGFKGILLRRQRESM